MRNMKNMKNLLSRSCYLLVVTVLIVNSPNQAVAQRTDCCCCAQLNGGQKAHRNGDYDGALKLYKEGLLCPDSTDGNNSKRCLKELHKLVNMGLPKPIPPKSFGEKVFGGFVGVVKDVGNAIGDVVEAIFPDKKKQPQKPKNGSENNIRHQQYDAYLMGDHSNTGEGDKDEKPRHSVLLSKFWISEKEVTFKEYDAFCDSTGREKPKDEKDWGRGIRPVIDVSWYDAIEYCNWLSNKEDRDTVYIITKKIDLDNRDLGDTLKWQVKCNLDADGFRLPTEAEWEYAASGRNKERISRFGDGEDIAITLNINFDGGTNFKEDYSRSGYYRRKTISVDSLEANAARLKHMSGNVSEWCWDWYGERYYETSKGPITNPQGPTDGSNRVCRGGSWRDTPRNCRISYRKAVQPIYRGNDVGFRIVSKKSP